MSAKDWIEGISRTIHPLSFSNPSSGSQWYQWMTWTKDRVESVPGFYLTR